MVERCARGAFSMATDVLPRRVELVSFRNAGTLPKYCDSCRFFHQRGVR